MQLIVELMSHTSSIIANSKGEKSKNEDRINI